MNYLNSIDVEWKTSGNKTIEGTPFPNRDLLFDPIVLNNLL